LKRITLTAPPRPALRLRESSFAEGRSTLEAIAEALAMIEGPQVAEPLFALHDLFVERVLRARGVYEQRLREMDAPPGDVLD
jgi:DTW domain-containing protein YfiP